MLEINKIYLGDNLELLKQLDDNSIHSCVSDFPYNLGFMGKKWDTISNYQEWCYERAIELLRVLKPGGYCLIFGGTRTHHRLVCAFEDAGFAIKDEMQWMYGNGFPKNYDISKGFDKKAGVDRIGTGQFKERHGGGRDKSDKVQQLNPDWKRTEITLPTTDLAKEWEGWGTALKPAQEPIMVAQKPIEKNYCYNIEKYGVGGLNIDECRVLYEKGGTLATNPSLRAYINGGNGGNIIAHEENRRVTTPNELGRFPSNIIMDKITQDTVDLQSRTTIENRNYSKNSGVSRFFYCPKSSNKDRNEDGEIKNNHPTVKPTELIKYLVKLVTPDNGICLDICEGSGTHAKAVLQLNKEGFDFHYIGFEKDDESYAIACQREEINKK